MDVNYNFQDEILKEVDILNSSTSIIESGFFVCRTANVCINDAKMQPIPKKLYYDLIIEGETTILFADTGIGKSIYAVQIAQEISKTQKVLYIDLELSDKQFQGRYSDNYQNEYKFNDNFFRVVFKRRVEIPAGTSYENYFLNSLKELINSTDAKVVIVDNMTKLISTDSDQARTAKPLMDSLNDLKFDYNLTMLLLEHNKKVDTSRPIHLNDLQGSKMKSDLVDAVFSIGRSSKDKALRYVKQLKVRSAEEKFDSENVLLYQIDKQYDNFLKLKFLNYSTECEHLRPQSENDKASLLENVRELSIQGKTQREISKELGISLGAVNKYLKK